MQIHEKIKQARISAGLTQDEMAEKLKIKRSTYQYWEEVTPSIDKIKRVIEVLKLPEDYFFVQNDENLKDTYTAQKEVDIIGKTMDGRIIMVEAKDLTASYERLIEEKERVIKIIEAQATKADKEKDRLFSLMEKYLTELLANSKDVKENISSATLEMQTEHAAMMSALDQIQGNVSGTLAAKAGNAEIALEKELQNKDSQADVSRQGKP